MAFIVEMFWGKPTRFVHYDLDSDGEEIPVSVEQVPLAEGQEPHRFFSCHDRTWQNAIALGKKFGWKPMGTVPADRDRKNREAAGSFENDYKPVDWSYIKRVLAEDAAALADSLATAHLLLKEGAVVGVPTI